MDLEERLAGRPDMLRFLREEHPRLAYHGYYRLLGAAGESPYTLSGWNDPSCWRFAWPELRASYFIIAFTAWGDQYAIDLDDSRRGVLFLDASEMVEEPIARGVQEFLSGEFQRIDSAPYDSRTVRAFGRIGPLAWDEGLGFVPPLLLADEEASCEVVKMNMRSLMIINGDVCSQTRELPAGALVERIETYQDELGRERLRLVVAQDQDPVPE
jgi:hypothetical protein